MKQNTLSATRYQPNHFATHRHTDTSLKGYLKVVSSLEVQAYNQTRLITRLTMKAKRLGLNKDINKPKKPRFSFDELLHTTNFFCVTFVSIAIALLIVLPLVGFFSLSIPGFIIFMCLAMIPDYVDYRSCMKRYRTELAQYNNAVSANSERISHELLVKSEIEQQIKCVKAELSKTESVRDSIYGLGVIHPSYRNLVAVCSLYDYLDKGICTKLTGYGGAYAFYEEELRFRRIETRLDIIISKLDEIIANQHQLASLIREGNAAIRRIEYQNNYMASTLNTICENTAVTEYNTRCAAQSATVMESIAIYRTLKYD